MAQVYEGGGAAMCWAKAEAVAHAWVEQSRGYARHMYWGRGRGIMARVMVRLGRVRVGLG